MSNTVLMPKAGISVESCIIGTWQKTPGDSVAVGDILFDYETDKATFECESTAEGTLLDILYVDGDEVPCLEAVCVVGQPGEDISEFTPAGYTEREKDNNEAVAAELSNTVDSASSVNAPQVIETEEGEVKLSPRAKSLAADLKLDPLKAEPSGPRGRIIERDVKALAEALKVGEGIGGRNFKGETDVVSPALETAAHGGGVAAGTAVHRDDIKKIPEEAAYTETKLNRIRTTIAKSMMASLNESAQLTHYHSFNATAVMAYRKQCKENGEALGANKISINDIVMYAVVKTLKKHPDINAHLLEGNILRKFNGVHLGLAVDTPRGLMVPTIFDADKKSLKELSDCAKELAGLCQSGSISPDLLSGASFTVSNLGSLGVEVFTPIINQPQVGILGVCCVTTKVKTGSDGNIQTYPSMGLCITYDHRAIDGAPASRFMCDLISNLENFQLLLAN